MENRLLFELDKEELIALRDTLNYAINIADEVEKARKNFKGLYCQLREKENNRGNVCQVLL